MQVSPVCASWTVHALLAMPTYAYMRVHLFAVVHMVYNGMHVDNVFVLVFVVFRVVGGLMVIPVHGDGMVSIMGLSVYWRVDGDGLHLRSRYDDWCLVTGDVSSSLSVLVGVAGYMVEHGENLTFEYASRRVLRAVGIPVMSTTYWFQRDGIIPYARPLLREKPKYRWAWRMLGFLNDDVFNGWLNMYRSIDTNELWLVVRLTHDDGSTTVGQGELDGDVDTWLRSGLFVLGPLSMTELVRELSSPVITMRGKQWYELADELALIGNDEEPFNVFWEELETVFPGYHDYTRTALSRPDTDA